MNNRLNKLETDLGVSEAANLLRFALPFIREREAVLKSLLLSGNLEEAANYAHKTIGSVGLYGSPRLEKLLKEVSTIDKGNQDLLVFQKNLSAEFLHVLAAINDWLNNH